MRKAIFLLLLVFMLITAPALAENTTYSLPGFTLDMPSDLFVCTRADYTIDKTTDYADFFGQYPDLYLYTFFDDLSIMDISLIKETLLTDYAKMDTESLSTFADALSSQASTAFPMSDVTSDIITHPQTSFICLRIILSEEEDTLTRFLYSTKVNGYMISIKMETYMNPIDYEKKMHDILASIVFSDAPPVINKEETQDTETLKTMQFSENGYTFTIEIPETMMESSYFNSPMPTEFLQLYKVFAKQNLAFSIIITDYWSQLTPSQRLVMHLDRANCDYDGDALLAIQGTDMTEQSSDNPVWIEVREINGRRYHATYTSSSTESIMPDNSTTIQSGVQLHTIAYKLVEDGFLYTIMFSSINDPSIWEETAQQMIASMVYKKE